MGQTPRPQYKESFSIGKGIAVAGIWLGTGLSAIWAGPYVTVVALFAVFATLSVA